MEETQATTSSEATAPSLALSDAERPFLTFALDLAFDQMCSGDGFTDQDDAALASLRKLASDEATQQPPTPDTLPAWLYQRFGGRGPEHAEAWDDLHDDDQSYWAHEAAAVRRAVARGGFKAGA